MAQGHETRQRSFVSNDFAGRAGRAGSARFRWVERRSLQQRRTLAFGFRGFVTMDLDGELIGGFASFKLNSCQSVI
jgi:hypothetical protein